MGVELEDRGKQVPSIVEKIYKTEAFEMWYYLRRVSEIRLADMVT